MLASKDVFIRQIIFKSKLFYQYFIIESFFFGKDFSCLLPDAPASINFSEIENGLNVTWKPPQ